MSNSKNKNFRRVFLADIMTSEKQEKRGEVSSHRDVKKRAKEWLK